jgi:hypothetical protein
METKKSVQGGNLLSLKLQSPRDEFEKKCSPLPFRICFRADLYPRVYFPDLTTRASLAEIDSVDLVALDFFVGAMVVVAGCLVCRLSSTNQGFVLYSTNDQGLNSEYTV